MGQNDQSAKKASEQGKSPIPDQQAADEAAPEFAVGIRVNDGETGDHVIATDANPDEQKTDDEIAAKMQDLFQDKINEGEGAEQNQKEEEEEGAVDQMIDQAIAQAEGEAEAVEAQSATEKASSSSPGKKKKGFSFGKSKKKDAADASASEKPAATSEKPAAATSEKPPAESEAQSQVEKASSKSPTKEKKSRFGFKKKDGSKKQLVEEAPSEELAAVQEAPKEEKPAESPKKESKSRFGKSKKNVEEEAPKEEAPPKEEKPAESPKKESKSRFGRSKKNVEEQAPVEEAPKEEKPAESPKKESKSRFGKSKKNVEEEAPKEEAPQEEKPKESPKKESKSRFGRSKKNVEEQAPVEEAPKEEKPAESPKKESKSRFGRSKKNVEEQAPKEEAPMEEAPQEEKPKKESKSRFGRSKKNVEEEAPKEEAPKEEAPKEEAPKEEAAPKEEKPKKEKKNRFMKKVEEAEEKVEQAAAAVEEAVEATIQEEEEKEVPPPLFVKEDVKKADKGNVDLSQYDPRHIKTVVLGNKMKAVLISDPLAEKSAVSLDVGIGNLHAPSEYNGLATFLQHMILNGSKKYPDQKKTDQYMEKFGGKINAYTGLDNTNFNLEIDHNGLDEGADRFANYFIQPLFLEDQKDKTLKIMHHQFKSALLNDEWKHLNLWMQLSNPDSITCRSVFPSKDQYSQPEAMDAVKDFHGQTYSANLMSVCIISNKSLSDIEKVAKKFKDIKNKKATPPNMGGPAPFGPDDGQKLIKMTTNSDNLEMRFVWCLPYYSDKINSHNLKLFTQLFGFQGPKSIISHLKRDGLATSLECQKKSMAGITKFELVIQLTQNGYDNSQQVGEAIFQYAQNLREAGPQENFANEMNLLGQLKFAYPDRSTPLATSIKYSSKARKIPESDLQNLVKASYCRDIDGAVLQDIAEKFCDLNRVMIFLNSSEPQDLTERWTSTKYSVVETGPDYWKLLEEPTLGNVIVNVPEANNLVPQGAEEVELVGNYSYQPVQLNVENAWYVQDSKFRHPKAIVQLQIATRDCGLGTSARGNFFAQVWRKVLTEYAAEVISIGQQSGCTFYPEVNDDNITLYWKGYGQTLPEFVMQTLNMIISLNKAQDTPLLDVSFANSKQWLIKDLEGAQGAKSYRKAMDTLESLLVQGKASDSFMAALIGDYSQTEFVREKSKWMKTGHSTWLVHGQISFDAANALCENANNLLKLNKTPLEGLTPSVVVELKKGTNTIFTVSHENSSFDANLSYYQLGLTSTGSNFQSDVLTNLVHTYMALPFVDDMKNGCGMTKVAMRESYYRGVAGMWFLTMSDRHSSEDQTQLINDHLTRVRGQVKKISSKDFEGLKSALKDALTANPKDFAQENDRVWREISSHQYVFDRQAQSAQALDAVTRDEFIGHFETLFFSKDARRLDVQMVTSAQKSSYAAASKNNAKGAMAKILKRNEFKGTLEDYKTKASYHNQDGVNVAYTAMRL